MVLGQGIRVSRTVLSPQARSGTHAECPRPCPGMVSDKAIACPELTEWDKALVCPELCPIRHGSGQSPRVPNCAQYPGTVWDTCRVSQAWFGTRHGLGHNNDQCTCGLQKCTREAKDRGDDVRTAEADQRDVDQLPQDWACPDDEDGTSLTARRIGRRPERHPIRGRAGTEVMEAQAVRVKKPAPYCKVHTARSGTPISNLIAAQELRRDAPHPYGEEL
ncbi:hypothetical protein Bbelb_334360 [Branchiostoma belcheri]|nr:hypothetical protein Bbelb_334360 [Branchiostoma belcheri]